MNSRGRRKKSFKRILKHKIFRKRNIFSIFSFVLGIVLIILTAISLIINTLQFTNQIYSWNYNTERLNNLLTSNPFGILLWFDNILIYICSILYIVSAIKSKKDILIKISFSLFSILTTIVVTTLLINVVASIFGIF